MPITLIGNSQDFLTTTSTTDSTPTGTQDDDVIIKAVGKADDPGTFNADGFTKTTGMEIATTSGNDILTGLQHKVAASEGATQTISHTGASIRTAWVLASFRGVHTDIFDIAPSSAYRQEGTNDPTPPNTDITTLTDGAWVIIMGWCSTGQITAWVAPTDFTLIGSGVTSNPGNIALAYQEIASAGPVTIGDWQNTFSGSDAEFHTKTIALKPAAVASSSHKKAMKYGMAYGTWNN